MKKTLISLVVLAMAIGCFAFAGCTTDKIDDTGSLTYVSLKINPEVEFMVSEDGTVVSANNANEDAEILLSDVDLTGEKIEDATETVVNLATEAGYIDVDTTGKDVEVGVIDENGEENTEIYKKIEKNINSYFENNGIFGKVSKATLDEYAEQAIDLGYSVGHVKLMMLAIDHSGKTLDELKDMKTNEIVRLIHNNNKNKAKQNGNCENKAECKRIKDQKCKANAEKLKKHQNNVNCNKDQIKEQIRQWRQGTLIDN